MREIMEKSVGACAPPTIEERAERYRDSFAGVIQGACEECGNCAEDSDGKCACDRIVDELIGRIVLIDEEDAEGK